MSDLLTPPTRVLEGTWEEVSSQGPSLAGKRVRVTVLEDAQPELTLEEQERLLDELAAINAHLPPLPEDAMTRAAIYDDHD